MSYDFVVCISSFVGGRDSVRANVSISAFISVMALQSSSPYGKDARCPFSYSSIVMTASNKTSLTIVSSSAALLVCRARTRRCAGLVLVVTESTLWPNISPNIDAGCCVDLIDELNDELIESANHVVDSVEPSRVRIGRVPSAALFSNWIAL